MLPVLQVRYIVICHYAGFGHEKYSTCLSIALKTDDCDEASELPTTHKCSVQLKIGVYIYIINSLQHLRNVISVFVNYHSSFCC